MFKKACANAVQTFSVKTAEFSPSIGELWWEEFTFWKQVLATQGVQIFKPTFKWQTMALLFAKWLATEGGQLAKSSYADKTMV